ncbi:transposase [Nonomuraea helvata]|uniref:Transposase n=1 Tax=Nonomuraea helvata TaxID=37484 RepID=A0ABV5S6Z5_9ACTN
MGPGQGPASRLAASWQDRDGGKTALLGTTLSSPIRHVFADQGFAGRFVDWANTTLKTIVEIVRKPAEQRDFAVHPRRWVVERTLAWLTALRRLARDYERHPETSEASSAGPPSTASSVGSPADNLPADSPTAPSPGPDQHLTLAKDELVAAAFSDAFWTRCRFRPRQLPRP